MLKRLNWQLPEPLSDPDFESGPPVFVPWKLEHNRSLPRMVVPAQAERVANFDLLARLAGAAETHDLTTARHLENIQSYARTLSVALGCSETFIREMEFASIMHDVGKIGVPKLLLNRSSSLDEDAWVVMRQHPLIGEKLLSMPGLEMARQVARGHHERWDGTGYPDNLAGPDIPLSARIVAVADVYDALTSKRPYKRAWSPEEALAEIRGLAGSQFDPHVVDVFLHALASGDVAEAAAS